MGDRLWIHGSMVSVGVLSLLLSGCQGQPKAVPPARTSASLPPPAPIPGNTVSRRETIFFIKGDASLSPGALGKLKAWTESWGTDGTWTLAWPTNPGVTYDLLEKRVLSLRSELRKFGVTNIETKMLPQEPVGQYDVIYIVKESP